MSDRGLPASGFRLEPKTRSWIAVLPLAALVLLGAYALAVDLTTSSRLPTAQDWAEASAAVRSKAQPTDGVQVWPPWAERARSLDFGAEVFTDEDLRAADYAGLERLWLVTLPDAPNAKAGRAREALRSRGAAPLADARRFGELGLELWDLRQPPRLTDLVPLFGRPVFQEVSYVPRRCVAVPIGPPHAPVRVRAEAEVGSSLHVRAGLVGERGYDRGSPPVSVVAAVDGAKLPALTLVPVIDPAPGWQRLDQPLTAGPPRREVTVEISSPNAAGRHVCLSAWTTR